MQFSNNPPCRPLTSGLWAFTSQSVCESPFADDAASPVCLVDRPPSVVLAIMFGAQVKAPHTIWWQAWAATTPDTAGYGTEPFAPEELVDEWVDVISVYHSVIVQVICGQEIAGVARFPSRSSFE